MVGVTPAGKPLDGINQTDALKMEGKALRDEVYIGVTDSQVRPAIRHQNWKLIQGDGSGGRPDGRPTPDTIKNDTDYMLLDMMEDNCSIRIQNVMQHNRLVSAQSSDV